VTSRSPHIRDEYSPLQHLAMNALRLWGEYHPSTMDSDMSILMLDLANDVVGEWNDHPYVKEAGLTPVDEYVSIEEARSIPDDVMTKGILAHYAVQQFSPKAQLIMPQYYKLMNRRTWDILSGGGKIRLRQVDGGTTPDHQVQTNPTTGMPADE